MKFICIVSCLLAITLKLFICRPSSDFRASSVARASSVSRQVVVVVVNIFVVVIVIHHRCCHLQTKKAKLWGKHSYFDGLRKSPWYPKKMIFHLPSLSTQEKASIKLKSVSICIFSRPFNSFIHVTITITIHTLLSLPPLLSSTSLPKTLNSIIQLDPKPSSAFIRGGSVSRGFEMSTSRDPFYRLLWKYWQIVIFL